MDISIKFNPHPLQKQLLDAYLDDRNKFIVAKWGRRCGKSFLGTYILLRHLLSYADCRAIYVSPTFKLSLEMFNLMIKKLEGTPLLKTYSKSEYKIELYNGSILEYFSAGNPDAIRGRTVDFGLIDECAFVSDYAVNECIMPCFSTSKNPKIIMISTPRFKKGVFYEFFDKGVKRENGCISFSGASNVSPYVNKDYLDLMKKTLPERTYKTEIEANFMDAGDGLFKYQNSKISNVSSSKRYFFGIDVGKGDKSSLAIINEKCEVVSLQEWGGSDYPTIMAKMLIKINEYKCEKGYLETNGVGSPLFDFMVKELGKSKLLPWVSTNTSKNNMIENLQNGFDKNNIKILDKYYDLLTSQLDNVTVEYNPTTRTIKYLFARDEDGHSDSVISTGLAYKAWCDFFIKGTAKIQIC